MTRYLLALMILVAPLMLSGCVVYPAGGVVVRERPGYYPPPYRGYWGPGPGYGYGHGYGYGYGGRRW